MVKISIQFFWANLILVFGKVELLDGFLKGYAKLILLQNVKQRNVMELGLISLGSPNLLLPVVRQEQLSEYSNSLRNC